MIRILVANIRVSEHNAKFTLALSNVSILSKYTIISAFFLSLHCPVCFSEIQKRFYIHCRKR